MKRGLSICAYVHRIIKCAVNVGTHYCIEWLLWSAVIVTVYKMKVNCNVREGNEKLCVITTRVVVVVVVVIYSNTLFSIT